MITTPFRSGRERFPEVPISKLKATQAECPVSIFIFWGTILILISSVVEGPLRYGLATAGHGSLLYLRDLLAVAIVMVGIYKSLAVANNLLSPLLVAIYTLTIYFIIGLLQNNTTIFSSLFGIKVFLGTLVGIAAADSIFFRNTTFLRIVMVILAVSITGIFANSALVKFPWEGVEFETAFGTTSTSREWTSFGQRRLPGLARASFDAAMIVGLCFALILPMLNKRSATAIGILCFAAIYLTTTKGMLQALLLVMTWWIIFPVSVRRQCGTMLCGGLLVLMVTLPLIACVLTPSVSLLNEVPPVLMSFAERITVVWPQSCQLIQNSHSWILGAGIGSIGVPQQFGLNAADYSPADNMFIYIFLNGGLIWFIGMTATLAKGLKGKTQTPFVGENSIRAMFIVIFAYGITTNMQEQPFFAIIAGVLIGLIWKRIPSTMSERPKEIVRS